MPLAIKVGEWIEARYRIERLLGEGSMSVVYEAQDKESGEKVALKFLKEKVTSVYVEDQIRFKREAEAVSKLDHTGIVRVKGIGYYEKRPYLIEEVLEGESLSERMRREKAVTAEEAVRVVRELAEALEYVHARGIVHRDIKPANVFITKQGKVKLIDFGIAHVMELAEIREKKEIVGTFGYMSPEATGMMSRTVDERSDLYSAGVLLYEMLSNRLPFEGEDIGTIMHRQVTVKAPRLREIKRGIPVALDEMVQKLLEKEQELRYQSAKGLRYDLERYEKGEKEFVIGEKDQKVKLSYQSKLVGREKELERLKRMCEEAKGGKGRICLVGGEPGVGKTRLVDSLRYHAYEAGYHEGGLFLRGRCLNQANKTPYQVFRDVLNEYISKYQKMGKGEQEKERERIKGSAGMLGKIILQLNPNMGEILGEVPELVALEPEKENRRFQMTASEFLMKMAPEDEISILFLDDLQWADDGSLGLLKEMTENIGERNILIVGTYRTEEVGEGHGLKNVIGAGQGKVEQLELRRFDTDRMRELTAAVLGEEEKYVGELSEFLLKKTKGNPFFTITVLRELVEEKALAWKEGRWQEDWEKIRGMRLGENIIDLVLKRIGELNRKQDELLCLAAMIGREFELELLYRLIKREKEEVIRTVDELIGMQLIEEGREHGKLLFVHDRIREAFLKKISHKQAREMHWRIAGELEVLQGQGEDKEKYLFDLAYHFVEAGAEDKVLEYAYPAAVKAKAAFSNGDALKYFDIYITLLEKRGMKGTEKWIQSKIDLVELFVLTGRPDEAILIANTSIPLMKRNIDKAYIHRFIGKGYWYKGDFTESEKSYFRCLKLMGQYVPVKVGVMFFIRIIWEFIIHILTKFIPIIRLLRYISDKEKYQLILQTGLELNYLYVIFNLYKFAYFNIHSLNLSEIRIGKSFELARSRLNFGSLFMATPKPFIRLSERIREKAYKLSKTLNDRLTETMHYMYKGYYYTWDTNEYQKSIELFLKAEQYCKNTSLIWELAIVENGLGFVHHYMGEYDKSIEAFTSYLQISQQIHDNYGTSTAMAGLCYAYVETGELDKAEEWGKKSITLSAEHRIWYSNCFGRIYYGFLKTEKMEYQEAVKILENARRLFRNNFFQMEYTSCVYAYLMDAYIEEYLSLRERIGKEEVERKRKELKKRLKKYMFWGNLWTQFWRNHWCTALRVNAKYYWYIRGKKRKAEKLFLESIGLTEKIGRRFEEAKSRYEYGKYLNETGKEEAVREEWGKARKIFETIGAKEYLKRTEVLLGAEKKAEAKEEGEVLPQERLALERRMRTVLETSRYLSSILILEELLEKIMEKTMELTGAQRGILYLYPEGEEGKGTRELKPAVVKITGEIKRESFHASNAILDKIVGGLQPVIVRDAAAEAGLKDRRSIVAESVRSVMGAPIVVREKIYGVIYLDNSEVSSLFKEKDLDVLAMISNQAGISIENALLYSSLKDKERLKREMEIAERIQTSLLPKELGDEEFEITAIMRTATEVGGDFYDVQRGPDGKLWLAIGDVMGHGVTPGLIMMMAQSVFSSEVRRAGGEEGLEEVMKMMNRILYENIQNRMKEDYYMTLQLVRHEGGGRVRCAGGGHPYMVWYRRGKEECKTVETKGTLIGVKGELGKDEIKEKVIEMGIGDILVLYTDGVSEARREGGEEMYGIERLKGCVKRNSGKPLEEIRGEILRDVDAFSAGHQADDVTMVLVKRRK